jgi:hypothetical protein
MPKRPTSIAVIAWILIVVAGISLITTTFTLNNPTVKELMSRSVIPVQLQFAMMYSGLLVQVVSGIALLKGKNWARLLYTIWTAVALAIGLATSPMKTAMVPGVVLFVVIVVFLFLPKANAYFKAKPVEGAVSGAQAG